MSMNLLFNRYTDEPMPRASLPKSRSLTTTTTDELIDLTRPPPPDATATCFSFDLPLPQQHSRHGSADSATAAAKQQPQTPYYHFGDRSGGGGGQTATSSMGSSSKKLSLPSSLMSTPGPAKLRRDWSSLAMTSSSSSLMPHDYINVRMGGGGQQHQLLEADYNSGSLHARQSSNHSAGCVT